MNSKSAHRNPRTFVVTGAGSGIGLAVAEGAAARGDFVVLNGRTESKLRSAAARLRAPDRVTTVVADMTEVADANRIIDAAVERFGRLDVLVNNAGIFSMKPFTDYTVDDLDTYLAYLRGMYVITQAAVRCMRAQAEGGAIVNISTILALNGVAGMPSSAPIAAKGGITALTRNLAIELATDRIRVNAVAPGLVPTPLYGELSDEALAALHERQPLGRYGTPHDIAEAVLYLADADWVTGVILPVDGGIDAGGDGASRITRAVTNAT